MSLVDAVVTMSTTQYAMIRESWKFIDAESIRVIPPFVPSTERHALSRALGDTVLVSGLWRELYDYGTAVTIVEGARQIGHDLRLVIAASTADTDEEYRSRIFEMAAPRPWIEIHEDRSVQDFLPRCLAVLRTSTQDSFGLVLSEALWAGIPIVATNVATRPDVAMLFSPGEAETATRHLAAIASNRETFAREAVACPLFTGTDGLVELYNNIT